MHATAEGIQCSFSDCLRTRRTVQDGGLKQFPSQDPVLYIAKLSVVLVVLTASLFSLYGVGISASLLSYGENELML